MHFVANDKMQCTVLRCSEKQEIQEESGVRNMYVVSLRTRSIAAIRPKLSADLIPTRIRTSKLS